MTAPSRRFLRLPWVALATCAGVLLISEAHGVSRIGHDHGPELFWYGLVLIVFPASLLLSGRSASRTERAATLVLVGLGLYAAKVLRDPFAFTFGDELAHLRNVQQIEATGKLFGTNTILPVTPRYPGLESVTAMIAKTSGASPFAAGLIVIGAARSIFMLSVFLIYERLTGSMRVAGIGTLICTAAPTFLFFSAQFSYESLAIPLGTVGLFALVRRQSSSSSTERQRWGVIIVMVAAGLVATHHLTSYAFLAFLIAVCIVTSISTRPRDAPWVETGAVTAMVILMLMFVAADTVGYLSPVLSGALDNIIDTVKRETGPRALFKSDSGSSQTPIAERIAALAAIVVLVASILAGLRVRLRQWASNPILLIFMLAALAYLAIQPLRLVPAAWETANRAGSLLYLGVGVSAAAGLMWWLERREHPGPCRHMWVAAAVSLLVGGGIIAGWPADLRLAHPFRVEVGDTTLESPSVAAANWSRSLPRGTRIAAQDADARLFVVVGGQPAFEGVNPDFQAVLDAERLEPWQKKLLRDNRIRLVAVDRRRVSANNIAGYFFDRGQPDLAPTQTVTKFNLPTVDRLYDNGSLVIFDVGRLR